MSEREAEAFIAKLDEGLKEAERVMLEEKALHDEDVIVADKDGNIKSIPAKQILAERK